MIIIRPTLKLAAKLKLTPLEEHPPTAGSWCDWCVRSFMAGRKSHLIFSHTESLYSIVVPQRGVTNAKGLRRAFATGIHQHLDLPAAAQHHVSALLVALTDCHFARGHDRAVLGSINDLAWIAENHLLAGDSLTHTNQRLNEAPMSLLGMDSPKEALIRLV
ncbi:DUF6933 domain-containing protein [Synoicihabitans lomoniglobus]|uniref:DUF6933 domain-containing protein n=1 Tax=Synoicihabitans lomoniglobus TaxID=2909285 RepID=A0AAF0CN91_9BACT|nr:hypothetical protein [Opitutaceae bacterium LMO-M01]WED64130.1 hypothetical protein PXH66_17470 [Opitutaceae bacterium LMO-M01]